MSFIRGRLGEERVGHILRKLPRPDYQVGNNIVMWRDDNYSMQIDHLVVSIYGLFLVETKNLYGKVWGRKGAYYWRQETSKGNFKVYNPCMQINRTIKHLEKIFWSDLKIYPILCFTERSELDIKGVPYPVVRPLTLLDEIKKYTKKVYSLEQVDYMVNKIRERVRLYRNQSFDHGSVIMYLQHKNKADKARRKNYSYYLCE